MIDILDDSRYPAKRITIVIPVPGKRHLTLICHVKYRLPPNCLRLFYPSESMSSLKPLFIVAGVGNSAGTGAAAAYVHPQGPPAARSCLTIYSRLFAKNGYSVALISRARSGGGLDALAEEISEAGGTVSLSPDFCVSPSVLRHK